MNNTTHGTPKNEDSKKSSQRGSTLTGYSITLALMVVMALGSIAVLEDNSETFLSESGNSIGSPRLTSYEASRAQLVGVSTDGNSLGVLPSP